MRENRKRPPARVKPPVKKVSRRAVQSLLPDPRQTALDGISESVCHLDLKNRVLWANRRAAQLLGLKPEEVAGKYCHRLWKGQPKPCPDCPAQLAQKTGRKQSKEVVDKQGRIWEVTVQPLKDRDGKVQSVLEFRRDVTEARLAAERLRKESQERAWAGQTLEQLARAADEDKIFKLIAAGIQRLAGESLVVASSYDPATGFLKVREMAGRPEDVKLVAEVLAGKISETGFTRVPEAAVRQFCLGRLVHLKGGLAEATFGAIPARPLKALAAKLKVSEVWGMGLCHGRDINGTVVVLSLGQTPRWNRELMENFISRASASLSRVRFESQRRYSQEYFRAIIDHTSDIIAITEPEGAIKFISRAAESELGYQPESLVGRDIYGVIHPEDVPGMIARYGQELSRPGQSARFSLRVRHREGNWLLLECTAVNLSRNREVGGVLVTARNLTGESQAKSDLRTTEDKLKAMFESIADGVAVIDAQGRITELNQEVLRQAGYSAKEEMLGRNMLEFIPAEDRERASRTLEQIMEDGESRGLEMPFIARDGSRKEFDLKVSLLSGAGGRPEGFIALLKDIGQRRAAEQLLKESERKFREMADFLPQTVFETDADGMITYVNRTGLAKFGYGPEDIASGISIFQVLAPQDRERARANFTRRAQGGPPENQEYRALSFRGERYEVAIYADQILDNGKFAGFRGVVIDVTERNRIARDLQEAQFRMRHLLTASPAVIYSLDPARNNLMTFISDNVAEVLGYRTEEFIRDPGFRRQILHPEDVAVLDRETDLLMRQGHHTFEYRLRHRDGRYRWIRDGLQVIYDQQGKPTEAIGCWIDISDLIQAEDSLLAERDIIKGIFDSSPDALLVTSLEGRIINRNRAAAELLGQEGPSALLGSNITDLAEDLSREKLDQIKKRVLAEGRFDDLSLVMVASGGRRIQAEATIGLTRDAQGAPLSFVAVIRDVGQRRRMEQAIRDSDEKHRLLMENINSPILSLDRDFNVLYCNQAYCEAIGYQSHDLIGFNLLEKFPSFKTSSSCKAYHKCLKSGKPQFLEGQFNQRFLQVRVYPVKWGLLAVADDITVAKSAQQEAEESRRQLETLMGNLPGLAYRCRNDRYWTMEFVSQGCLDLTGYAPEEILDNRAVSFGQCIHPQDQEMVWDDIQQSLAAKKPYQLVYRIFAKDGAVKWVWEQGQGIFDQQGRLKCLEGFITDISERKLAEEALNLSEFQYRSTIDSLGEGIHVVDRDLTITLTNQVFREWNQSLGLSSKALGKNIFEVYPFLPREKVREEYAQVFRSGQVLLTRETNRVADREITTETRKIPILDEGRVTRVVTVVSDITQEVKNQEAVRENDLRLALLSDNLPSGLVYQIDSGPDGRDRRFTYISAGVEELHGLTVEQVLADGSAIYQQVLPEDLKRVAALEAEAEMTQFRAELRVRMPSGEVRWRLFSSASRRAENGHLMWDGIELDITEQKQAAVEIEELNRRLEYSLEAARTGFDIIDGRNNIRYVDPGWEKTLGDYRGKKCYQYFMGRDKPCQKCGIAQALKTKQKTVTEEFLHREQRWVEVHTIPFQNSQGEWLAAEFNIDINDRKNVALALEKSEERYRILAENSREVIWTAGLDNRFTYLSPAIEKLQGFTVAEAMELGIEGLVTPGSKSQLAEIQQGLLDLIKKGPPPPNITRTADFECRHKSGGTIWCQITVVVVTDAEGRSLSLLGVNRDITERKLSEQKLVESEAKYRQVFEGVAEGIYRSTPDGKPLMANPALARMLGYDSVEELLQRDIAREGYLDPGVRKAFLERIEKDGFVGELVSEWRRKDGSPITLRENAHAVRDASGRTIYYEGTAEDITLQRKAEQELEDSRNQFWILANISPVGIFRTDAKGRITYVNPRWRQISGLAEQEAMGDGWLKAVHPDDRAGVSEEWRSFVSSVEPIQSEYRFAHPDGSVCWVMGQAVPDLTGDGRLAGYIGTITDITERKLVEQQLAESEVKYRALFDQASDGIMFMTVDGARIMVNQSFARMHGYDRPEEMGNVKLDDLDSPEGVKLIPERLARMIKGESISFETEHRHRDGHFFSIQVSSKLVRIGDQEFFLGFHQDITGRKKSLQELAESELMYRTMMDQANDAIFLADPETGTLVDANLKAQQLTGYSLEELRQMHQIQLHPPEEQENYRRIFAEHIRTGQAIEHDLILLHRDGRRMPVDISANLIEVKGRKLLQGIFHDLSERYQMEQALLESETKYRQIFEGIAEGIYRSTPEGRLLFANPSLAKMLGYESPEQVQGADLNTGVYLDQSRRERFKREIAEQGRVAGFESEVRSRDGAVRVVSENAILVRDKQGNPIYYDGTLEDITERKAAERALKEEKDHQELLFKVSLAVAKAPKLQDKLELTIKGIKGCRLFRKALILMEGRDGLRNYLAQYGLTESEISGILKTSMADAKRRGEILQEKYRVSNSYFIPHHQTEIHRMFSFRSVSPEYRARGSWHPDDVLIVPLNIKGVPAGYLSVDEPFDGNIPGLETIHLLELFANQAAISVENMSLYNELEKSYYDTLKAFVAAMDAKDPYTKGHSENVRHYALKIARHIGLPEKIIRLIDYSALLHDIGKLGIREEILSKPEVLSDSEYQEVKLHPVIGSRLVSEIDLLNQTENIIYSHHEYFDGNGYPRGIKGQDIPLEARIIAVADAFEAMTSDRPYRKAFSFEVAMQRLVDAAGTQFDEQVVKVFAELSRRENPGKEDR